MLAGSPPTASAAGLVDCNRSTTMLAARPLMLALLGEATRAHALTRAADLPPAGNTPASRAKLRADVLDSISTLGLVRGSEPAEATTTLATRVKDSAPCQETAPTSARSVTPLTKAAVPGSAVICEAPKTIPRPTTIPGLLPDACSAPADAANTAARVKEVSPPPTTSAPGALNVTRPTNACTAAAERV